MKISIIWAVAPMLLLLCCQDRSLELHTLSLHRSLGKMEVRLPPSFTRSTTWIEAQPQHPTGCKEYVHRIADERMDLVMYKHFQIKNFPVPFHHFSISYPEDDHCQQRFALDDLMLDSQVEERMVAFQTGEAAFAEFEWQVKELDHRRGESSILLGYTLRHPDHPTSQVMECFTLRNGVLVHLELQAFGEERATFFRKAAAVWRSIEWQ